MTAPRLAALERTYGNWQIWLAVPQLDDPDERVRSCAVAALTARSPHCWPRLRRVAFRQRSRLAIRCAELLYQLGDSQGLYALLTQFSDRYMHVWYGPQLRKTLVQIGPERILNVLTNALDRIETPPLPAEHWSLSLSVYALRALEALRADPPPTLWRRSFVAFIAEYEDLRVCRAFLPDPPPIEVTAAIGAAPDDWRVGSTLVAVRHAAIDALLSLNPTLAFDLLCDALAHPDPQVQLTALYGLRRLRDPRALVLLQPIAADRRHPLHRDARRALEAIGSPLSDALTLVRAAHHDLAAPDELLRPAPNGGDPDPDTLLRVPPPPSSPERPGNTPAPTLH